jgi:hypothetical protein
MLRWVTLTLVFIGISLSCFSEESHRELKAWQLESLQYFGNGSARILSHEPWQALEDLQRASLALDKTDPSSSVISFLIFFGQAIACDSLGFREHCNQSLGALLMAMNEYDDEEENLKDNEDHLSANESEEAIDFFEKLACCAPSLQVRQLLLSIVEEIAEDALPAFRFADSAACAADWVFDGGNGKIFIEPCKSWWSRCKKWAKEVLIFLGVVHEGYKKINDIREQHERGKNIH